jgi:hypothetical protein
MTYNELFIAVKNYLQNDFPTNTWTNVAGTGTTTSSGTSQINFFITQAEERVYNSVQIPALRKNVTGVTTGGNQYLSCPTDFLSVFSMAVIDGSGNYEYLLNKDVNFIRAAYPNPTTTGIPKYYALFGPTVVPSVPSSIITNELSFILGPTPDILYNVELHYYYYPESIIQGGVSALDLPALQGGSGYQNGVFYNVPLTGGTGSGAIATIEVTGGAVTSVTITEPGSSYSGGDALSASLLGGSGFSVPVLSLTNVTGTSWLGDNYSPVLLYGTLVEAYTFLKGEVDMVAQYEKKYQEALSQLNRLGTGLERGDAYRDGQAKIKVNP